MHFSVRIDTILHPMYEEHEYCRITNTNINFFLNIRYFNTLACDMGENFFDANTKSKSFHGVVLQNHDLRI